jgi:UDP-N-acetyl-D-mannosaminuronate dehydrogenase
MLASSLSRLGNITTYSYQFVNLSNSYREFPARLWVSSTNNPDPRPKVAIVGTQPEALLLSTLFAEAGLPNWLVGHFDEIKTKRVEDSGLNEARWLLGVHRKGGITHLLQSVEELAAILPSIVILTGHATNQKELSELERTTRALCRFIPPGTRLTFTGLCQPNFTGTILREMIEKYSGHTVGKDIELSYVPLFWGGETLKSFKEKPKLVSGFGTVASSAAQEMFLSIFPSITTSAKLGAAEAAGLFGPICRDVLRALEFELASLCEMDNVDYSEALELCRHSGTYNLGIPNAFVARDAIASNIAISGNRVDRGRMSIVRVARRINESGEQRVLDLVKNALFLCGRRFRHSRIGILGFTGLESPRDPKPSPPTIIRALERRGAILSVYPGRNNRWFESGILGDRVRIESTPLRAVSKTSCALVALDHSDFGEISPQKLASEMSHPGAICDLSRVLEASNVERAGLFYTSIGRGNSGT